MTDAQRWLTDLLKTSVGDPPRRVTVQAVRRRRARRHRAEAGGVALTAAVVAVLGIGISGYLGHPGQVAGQAGPVPVACRPGWSVTSGAVPAGDSRDWLSAMAGSASYDLWAVGYRSPHHSQKVFPLLEHWNGRKWAYSAGAYLHGRQAELAGVAAPAWNDVWVIGQFEGTPSFPGAPLVEHWNGKSWSFKPTSALAPLKAVWPQTLTSVTVLSPGNVWVLGASNTSSSDLYLHWNGASWRLITGPRILPYFGSAAMEVTGADRFGGLWAAGGTMRGSGEGAVPGSGIVERLNGRQWKVDKRLAWKEPLTMLAPVTPGDVWAIAGGNFTSTGTYGISPVKVLHWNGSTWQVTQNLGGAGSVNPIGLVAVSASDAYVMGQNAITYRPFIEHWNGIRWQDVPLGATRHITPPGGDEEPAPSLTLTASGPVAALDTSSATDRANYLWLKC